MLFVDIAASAERAVMLGDSQWRELLEGHLAAARRQLELFRGHEVDAAGDGLFATLDGPARAIRCAASIRFEDRGTHALKGLPGQWRSFKAVSG